MTAPDALASPTAAAPGSRVRRFTRAERVAHWVNAVLFAVTIATGLMFRFGLGQSLVPDRGIARGVHVYAGFGILVSFGVAMYGRYGAALRQDVRRLGRWSADDTRWLRALGGDRRARLGKFNPGQKLNATFVAAAAVVLAGSGAIMFWNQPFSTNLRVGANFVHGWFALGVGLSVFGHILMALRDREALRGITGGTVSADWARHHRPAWRAEPADD